MSTAEELDDERKRDERRRYAAAQGDGASSTTASPTKTTPKTRTIMGLVARTAALAENLASVAAEGRGAAVAMERAQTAQQKLETMRESRAGNTLDGLLNGPATAAVMSIYLQTLALNPNDPALSALKNFMRQFARVDESVWSQIEALAKKAHVAKNRERSNRGKALGNDVIQNILDEVTGR